MGSKSKLVFLALALFALLLLISSQVTAREVAKPSSNHKNGEVDGYGGGYPGGGYPGGGYPGGGHGGGYPGHGGGGYPGHGGGGYPGHGGGGYPGHGGGGHRGGYCRYGCCGGRYGGGCRRCCSYAGEAVDAQPETKPHN